MADRDDLLLRDAFTELTAHARPHVRPAGTAAARATVRHRRRVRTVALSALVAVLIIVPAAAWASRGGGQPVRPAETPTPSVPPTTTTAPAPSAPTTPPATTPPAFPDGRISADQLGRAAIDVPAWGTEPACPHGRLRFPTTGTGLPGRIVDSVQANLDGDDAVETAVLIGCRPGEIEFGMLLALDRDAGGRIVTKGVIVQSTRGMDGVRAVEPAPGGDGVRVQVADEIPCCSTPKEMGQTQWRTYGWVGDGYAQTGGPARFPANPYKVDLSVTAATVKLSQDANRRWTGTLKLTIRNRGPFAAAKVRVGLDLPGGFVIVATRPDVCGVATGCVLYRLAAGATTTLDVDLRGEEQPPTVTGRALVSYPSTNEVDAYVDLRPDDNKATIRFTTS